MDTLPEHERWDDVIVGAGSAGAVLASRLSEAPDRRVLLLEAGPTRIAPRDEPRALGEPVSRGYNWDFSANLGAGPGRGRSSPYGVGKVMGGSSAVNGGIALRGLPADFDGWGAAGNDLWSWEHVLPYFARMEDDPEATGTGHGRSGPLPIRRPHRDRLHTLSRAFIHGCRELGIPELPDLNAEASNGAGVGLVPSSASEHGRISTADAYLRGALDRENLTFQERCHVTRVLCRGQRAVGVEVVCDGQHQEFYGENITLSAGAINTPLIIQRSGIGPAGRLQALGVPPVAELPGVGENLADHSIIAVWALPQERICQQGQPWHEVMARVAGARSAPDLNLFLASNVDTSALPVISDMTGGRMAASVSVMLVAPQSRGSVVLEDVSWNGNPRITLGLATEPSDIDRLMHGVRLAWSIIRSDSLAKQLDRVLLWTDRMVHDDALLRQSIGKFVTPSWHPTGSARMGPTTDGMAVVDQECRVHQMSGLRVVDASVLPTIPRAPTNLTCIMLAERVAEWMA